MRRLRAEDGISLIPAIAMLVILVLLGGVALTQAVGALRHTTRQYKVKAALQAADAAIDSAMYALNRADLGGALQVDPLNPGNILQQNCVVSTGDVTGDIDLAELPITAPTDSEGRRWCSPTGAPNPGDEDWEYRVSQLARIGTDTCGADQTLSLDRHVVAVGHSGDVTRRVKVRLNAAIALLSGAAVQSGSATTDLTMSDTARVLGAVQSNASITGAATNTIAGNAIPGPGGAVSGPTVVGTTTPACHPFVLPAVDAAEALDDNDNGAWTQGCHAALTGLPTPCTILFSTTGGVIWSGGTRTLEVWGNGRAVLTGDTYALCHLRLRGSGQLVIPNSTPVARIFIDDPAECGGASGAGEIHVDGQARIVNCHLQTQPSSLQLYAVGNAGTATTQTFAGAGLLSGTLTAAVCGLNLALVGVPMTVYAPRSHVQIAGSTAIAGQVAGDSVELAGAAAVEPVNALINLNQLGANPVLPLYRQAEYVECTSRGFDELPEGDPAQGC